MKWTWLRTLRARSSASSSLYTCSYWGSVMRVEFGSLKSVTQSSAMPSAWILSASTSANRDMLASANGTPLPCHVMLIRAPDRCASATVRSNESIRSGNVHSVVLKKIRTSGARNRTTSSSSAANPEGGPLRFA